MIVDGAQTLLCWIDPVRALSGVGGKSGSNVAFISVDVWDIYSRYLKKCPVGKKGLEMLQEGRFNTEVARI
jgi:hypothetical protein